MQPVSLVHQLEAKNLLAKQVLCCQTQKIITTEMIWQKSSVFFFLIDKINK